MKVKEQMKKDRFYIFDNKRQAYARRKNPKA